MSRHELTAAVQKHTVTAGTSWPSGRGVPDYQSIGVFIKWLLVL